MAGFSKDTLSLPALKEYRTASNSGRWEGVCLACKNYICTAHLPQRRALDQLPRHSSSKFKCQFFHKLFIPHSKCWIFGKTVMDCYWLERARRLTHGRYSHEGLVWKPLSSQARCVMLWCSGRREGVRLDPWKRGPTKFMKTIQQCEETKLDCSLSAPKLLQRFVLWHPHPPFRHDDALFSQKMFRHHG